MMNKLHNDITNNNRFRFAVQLLVHDQNHHVFSQWKLVAPLCAGFFKGIKALCVRSRVLSPVAFLMPF